MVGLHDVNHSFTIVSFPPTHKANNETVHAATNSGGWQTVVLAVVDIAAAACCHLSLTMFLTAEARSLFDHSHFIRGLIVSLLLLSLNGSVPPDLNGNDEEDNNEDNDDNANNDNDKDNEDDDDDDNEDNNNDSNNDDDNDDNDSNDNDNNDDDNDNNDWDNNDYYNNDNYDNGDNEDNQC